MGKGKKSSKSSKPRAGTPIKKSSGTPKPAVGRKQGRLKAGAGAAAKAIISDIPIAGTLLRAGQSAKAAMPSRQTTARGFGARKKGRIPKAVRRWASRIVSRRKQEEKLVKKLFGAEGGKIIKKKSKSMPLDGIITRQEALKALRT